MKKPTILRQAIRLVVISFLAALFFACPAQADKQQDVGNDSERVLVNGKPFFIKAVAYSPSYPGKKGVEEIPDKIFKNDFHAIKEAGFNTLRTYDPLSPQLLDLAENEGLMVIQAVARIDGRTDFSSESELVRLKEEAVRIVRRDKGRKCILMWSLWNDAPFHWDKEGNVVPRYGFSKCNNFLITIYDAIKAEDSAHPVTGSNTLNAPGYQLGLDFIDIIGVNVYLGVTDWSSGAFDATKGAETVRRLQRIAKDYAKPVYVSEMGLSSFSVSATQTEAIPAQVALVGENLAGFTVFQWQDEWGKAGSVDRQADDIEAHWGLVDAHRKPKEVLGQLSALLKEIDTRSYGYAGIRPMTADAAIKSPGRKLFTLDDFEYADDKEAVDVFKNNWNSRVNVALTTDRDDRACGKNSLKVVFSAQDTGAWAQWHRYFKSPVDLSAAKRVFFKMKNQGPSLNMSLLLIDNDGERYAGKPVLDPTPLSVQVLKTVLGCFGCCFYPATALQKPQVSCRPVNHEA